MACYWKGLNVLALLLAVFVFETEEALARHTFVVAPTVPDDHGYATRVRREDSGQGGPDAKPKVKSLHIDSVIKYRYANTVVYSKLTNAANVSKEIGFTTVLPDAAFISGFAITINGTVYKAYVKGKEEAKQIYQEAVSRGVTAGHVELSARDSNKFTVSVNVEAFGKVDFNLTYEELLNRELGIYKHTISINPGQIVDDMKIKVVIHESSNITYFWVPELRESNELLAEESTENQAVQKEQPNGTTAIVTWHPTKEQQQEINGEGVKGLLEVQYDIDRVSQPNQILVNEGYFVHFFAPPSLTPLKKHVVFVLDRSGSMYGRKIEQVKDAMASILDELRTGDSFTLLLFSDNLQLWKTDGHLVDPQNLRGEPLSPLTIAEVTTENIKAAKEVVKNVDAAGGTYVYDALQAALNVVRLGINNTLDKEPIVIFLTDGQPNGPHSSTETIIRDTTSANEELSAVIYGLAFGNDADFNLLKKLSLKNSGFARKIYEASDASIQLKNFYKEVSSPILSGVTFHYLGDQVDTSTLTKTHFRNHNNGSEIVVAGKLANSTDVNAEVTGIASTGIINLTAYNTIEVIDYFPRPQVIQNATEAGFMERLWAYLTIKQLLDVKEKSDNETAKEGALELALRYSFVTPLTSLVVVKPNETSSATDLEKADDSDSNLARSPHRASMGFYPRTISAASLPGNARLNFQPHYHSRTAGFSVPDSLQVIHPESRVLMTISKASVGPNRGRKRTRGRGRTLSTTSTTVVTTIQPSTATPNAFDVVPLSNYTWLGSISNDTHVNILVNGNTEILQIGYNETDVPHTRCNSALYSTSHCRHLPHCSLSNFSQSIQTYLQYFCKIDEFIGVCCPDSVPRHR